MFEKEAEEYVNEEYDFCYYPEDNLSTRINAKHDWQNGAEFGYNKVNEWHDLRKDPNDLPKEDRYYLIFTNLGNYYVSKHHHNTNYWIGIQNQFVSIKQVIAWCEIPQFKE